MADVLWPNERVFASLVEVIIRWHMRVSAGHVKSVCWSSEGVLAM